MRKKLKIVFFTRSLPFHHVGGMEAVAWDLARSLVTRGHDVEVVTTQCSSLDGVHSADGVRLRTIKAPAGKYSTAYWKGTVQLYDELFKDNADVILSVGCGAYAIAEVRTREASPALIMQSHGQAWGELLSKLSVLSPVSWLKSPKNVHGLFMDRTLRCFDKVISIGPAVTRILETAPTKWLLGKTPVTTINNGVDEAHFTFDPRARKAIREKLHIPQDAPVMISASRLHVQKGVRSAIKGFEIARERVPGLTYIIVGTGPDEEYLKSYVEKQGLSRFVHFTGAIDRKSLPQMLSAGDVFAFTSVRQEGLALGPLEAAATGLKIVLSAKLAVADLTAVLVDPRNASDIADGLARAFFAYKRSASTLLPEQYTLDYAVSCYEAVFENHVRNASIKGRAEA